MLWINFKIGPTFTKISQNVDLSHIFFAILHLEFHKVNFNRHIAWVLLQCRILNENQNFQITITILYIFRKLDKAAWTKCVGFSDFIICDPFLGFSKKSSIIVIKNEPTIVDCGDYRGAEYVSALLPGTFFLFCQALFIKRWHCGRYILPGTFY